MDCRKTNITVLLLLLVLFCGCGNGKVDCLGCHGMGVFKNGNSEIECVYCFGEGKLSQTQAESLFPNVYGKSKPISTRKYCIICMGTGKFRVNSYPFESRCTMCGGEGIAADDRMNSNQPLYECVYCHRSGINSFGGGQCTFCKGYGISIFPPQEQERSSGRNSSELCGACGGRQVCPVCRVTGGVRYGDIQYCSTCGNTRRCPWCYGKGLK